MDVKKFNLIPFWVTEQRKIWKHQDGHHFPSRFSLKLRTSLLKVIVPYLLMLLQKVFQNCNLPSKKRILRNLGISPCLCRCFQNGKPPFLLEYEQLISNCYIVLGIYLYCVVPLCRFTNDCYFRTQNCLILYILRYFSVS